MKIILPICTFYLLLVSSHGASPNYITPLELVLHGDLLRVKPSTYYRVSQITKLEARVLITTRIEGKEDLIQQYPLDEKTVLMAESIRNLGPRGLGPATAQIVFCINGDTFQIALLSEKHFADALYFERSVEAARRHFAELVGKAQTHREQAGAGQPATRSVVEPEGNDKPQPEAEGRCP